MRRLHEVIEPNGSLWNGIQWPGDPKELNPAIALVGCKSDKKGPNGATPPSGTPVTANDGYQDGPGNQFTLCFLSDSGGPPGPCDEDAYPLASSHYGTFSQAGSLWEWNELRPGDTRPRRSGGSWGNNAARVAASVRADNAIGNGGASVNQGFRIARVYRPRPVFVPVGNPGNPADQDYSNGSGRQGAVSYEYQIGKYEVNNADYAIFLNAKARTDTNTLWDAGMQITREGEDGQYTGPPAKSGGLKIRRHGFQCHGILMRWVTTKGFAEATEGVV